MNTQATRSATLSAMLAGWSITLRRLDSGAYGKPDNPSGYMHATVTMRDGIPCVLTANGGWLSLLNPGQLSYGRRQRVRVGRLLLSWLDDETTLDSSLWSLTGEGLCEVCRRTLTRSVARGFTTGDACGGRVKATLRERKGWNLPLSELLARRAARQS